MDINKINDLKELQIYLKENFNINAYIKYYDKIKKPNISIFYIKLFLILFFSIIFIVLLIIFRKNIKKVIKKKLFFKIIFYLILIFLILCSIYLIHKYFNIIYLYHFNKKLYEKKYKKKSIDYNEIKFNTGDILQETTNWNYYNILLYLFPLKFLHNLMVINFKNKNYVLHFTLRTCGYPQNILHFNDTENIEIFLLDDYLKYNYKSVKYYRLFKTKKLINNDSIFEFLKNINYKDLKFSFMINIKEDNKNTYHCMSFLLKILNSINIIPKFNFQNFTSDDLIYLPELSNNIYDKPFMFEYIPENS